MNRLSTIEALIETLDTLREKCPWDRKQTMESLKNNTIEECYELVDAINSGDFDDIKEELGDILLHVLFYSKIADEQGRFNVADVADSVNQKLIFRHPHVFADVTAEDSEQVVKNWEQIKKEEKNKKGKSVLSGVPSALPAMIKSYRVQQKAAAVGFDWQDNRELWDKVKEEIAEFESEIESQNQQKMEEEFGDVMFSLVNVARKYKIDPEDALERCNKKFIQRFEVIEKYASEKGIELESMSLEEMESVWQSAKKNV